jgi:hypothetical protein
MNTLSAALSIYRTQGVGGVLKRVGERLSGTTGRLPSPLRREDALAVDWRTPHPAVVEPLVVQDRALTVAWIMSPPGESSGGHQNIYRFIQYLERAGHRVRIYFYSVGHVSLSQVEAMTSRSGSYPRVDASVELYPADGVAADVDAIFATGWETAYASFRDTSPARRLYFVQDFEPYFYPVGTDSVLAENTYRFGFTGVTAGRWLEGTLARDYGMPTASYDFSADKGTYSVIDPAVPRDEVFFYARPGTERRGFELGVLALELVARERPGTVINFAGWDVSRFTIPFPHNNLGTMPLSQLNVLYNRCAVGLVLSMTNMSLLPLELIAAGVIPVVNDAPNNTEVSQNPFIEYTEPNPRALADRIIAALDRPDRASHAVAASDSLAESTWDTSGARFVQIVEGVMRG